MLFILRFYYWRSGGRVLYGFMYSSKRQRKKIKEKNIVAHIVPGFMIYKFTKFSKNILTFFEKNDI